MENSQFVKGKGQILEEYRRMQRKVSSEIAGRGFSFEPGFMYDTMNEMEIDTKQKLSDLNYLILEEAVARELKQYGLNYDLAYKNAVVAWESDKAVLFSDLEKEISGVKRDWATEEEVLNVLAIEIASRSIDLLEAKTAIELEIEGYRKQLYELDGTTGGYEIQLANAKVLTAQKRLESIPFIEALIGVEREIIIKELSLVDKENIIASTLAQIIPKERTILDKEGQIVARQNEIVSAEQALIILQKALVDAQDARITASENLIAVETDVANQKEGILRPALEALIETMDRFIEELSVQLILYEQITDAKLESAEVKQEIAGKEQILLGKKEEINAQSTVLLGLLEGLSEYRTEKLSSAISELIVAIGYDVASKHTEALLRIAIANVRVESANLISQKVAGELDILDAEQSKAESVINLKSEQLELRSQATGHKIDMLDEEIDGFGIYRDAVTSLNDTITTERENTFSQVKESRKLEAQKGFDIRVNNNKRVADEKYDALKDVMNSEIDKMAGITEAKTSIKDVTARLNHLLEQA